MPLAAVIFGHRTLERVILFFEKNIWGKAGRLPPCISCLCF